MKSQRPKKTEKVVPAEPQKPASQRAAWWLHAVILLGLLLANMALYSGTFDLGFLSVDDPDYIQNNPHIDSLRAANIKHILTTPYFANYSPAHLLSYSVDVALAGKKSAFAFHLSNVLWHGWTVCAVYLLALTISRWPALASETAERGSLNPRDSGNEKRAGSATGAPIFNGAEALPAAAAALLFMLHPAHVEVAAWISSRKDLVATAFASLAMACYLLYRRTAKGEAWWYASSLLTFLLATAGKQSVLLLPAVMLTWDLLVEKRRSWRTLADKVPFGLIVVFFGWMTWNAQPSTNQARYAFVPAVTQLDNLWLLTGLGRYVLYRAAPDPAAWGQVARLAVIAAAALVWASPLLLLKVRATGPIRVVLCYWVLFQMLPPMVLNFIVPITDRYLLLPSVGVCLLLAGLVADLAKTFPRARWLCWAVLAALAATWGVKTCRYIAEWRDPRSVWYGAHFKTKTSQVAEFLGDAYQDAGDRINNFIRSAAPLQVTNELKLAQTVLGDEAQVNLLEAEWLRAAPARTNSIAYRDKLWGLAWDQYEAAVARRGRLSAPNLFMNRGRLLVSEGKFQQSIPQFQKALAFAETSTYLLIRQETVTHALHAIGVAYWHMGQYRQAHEWLLKAQAAQRKSGQVWIPALDRDVERIKALAASQS
jgi:hypothetical protein